MNQPTLIEMGPEKVQDEGMNLGLLGDDGTLGIGCMGLNREGHEITNKKYILTGAANHRAGVDITKVRARLNQI